jgi:hypothetical protein
MVLETEVLGENVPHCQFGHYISHMILPGIETGPSQWETYF